MTLIADTMSSASAGWPTMTLPVTRMSVPMPWGRPGVDGISGVLVSGTVAVWVRVSVLDVAVTVTVGVLAGLVDAGLLELLEFTFCAQGPLLGAAQEPVRISAASTWDLVSA
jgi:hypothetical protein